MLTEGRRRYHDKILAAPKRKLLLPDQPARTRFAPSPTGYLHIGGLRTALFSYLLAKRTGGQFLLRIEDTDQKRLVPGAEERLLDDLQWAGLQWDEGPQVGGPYGPYRQSERNDIYQQHARDLLDAGAAYRCFCTPQTAGQGAAAYVTSGCYQNCTSLSADEASERAEDGKEPFTVRLKRPAVSQKRVYSDLVYGKITPLKRSPTALASADTDSGIDASDTILVKSDGTPTYHFANVVDDHLMKITHVIRGTEWMASTPLHYDLYHAFGWTPPAFAHVGLLVDEKKAKLSKRNVDLALDVQSMRDKHGVLPDTLVNFLALLGWSNPTDNDVMDMRQLIDNFDLKFTKGNTMVRMEKLWYLQKHHVARRCDEARISRTTAPINGLLDTIVVEAKKQFPEITDRCKTDAQLRQYCQDILLADSKAYQNAEKYVQRNRYFFAFDAAQILPPQEESSGQKQDISAQTVHGLVKKMLEEFDFKQPYRTSSVAGTGSEDYVPSPDDAGRLWFEKDSARIHAAIYHHIWSVVLHDTYQVESKRLPFTDQPIDDAAFVGSFGSPPRAAGGQEEVAHPSEDQSNSGHAVEAVVQSKKDWSKAVLRSLRGQLSGGLPGPSIGVVMAILGYEECCRRLGVQAREGGGW
ncbi:hypothetical protein LTR36_001951 [Oleoguttula mirabilis]|uniref:Glutamate--tRNA ligase, mitochondrial n=1 Tax=Oleoguttula mirabilis TaxID=1507867 RepID=A0AAV9JL80_9PEZI|nr:hypothetical protein LTR36_001951 [Oleoguttula mirabilis]